MTAPQHDRHCRGEHGGREAPPLPAQKLEPLWQSALAVLGIVVLAFGLVFVAAFAERWP